ncbi:MAG: ABC transporter substrate-binding protein [Promethearchaeota archaeon]
MNKKDLILTIIILQLVLFYHFFNAVVYHINSSIGEEIPIRKSQAPVFQKSEVSLIKNSSSLPSILRIGVHTPAYYLQNEEPFFDPLEIGWVYDRERNSLLYEALVQYDPQSGDLIPALATQWVVSNDSRHWTFYLRDDVVFHDGSKFNASSVEFTFERLSNPEYLGYYVEPKPYKNPINFSLTTIDIDNEYQITLNFKESNAAFIHECPYYPLASPNSFYENGTFRFPIGTGPYRLQKCTFNKSLAFQNCTFSRFTDYYQGLPPFEQIHYLNQESFEDEVTNHSIDVILLFSTVYEQLKNDEYWDLNVSNEVNSFELGFFNHHHLKLKDTHVRLAINYAIDRQDYINKLNWIDTAVPMTNLIPPSVLFHNESIPGFPYNVSLANELLDQAGYTKDAEGWRFSLRLVGSSNRLPEIIGSYLNAIGISTIIDNTTDWSALWEQGNYDICLYGAMLSYDPDFYRFYLHSSSLHNTGKFVNTTIDELLTLGARVPVRQEREYYYHQLQPLIQEAAPYLHLTYNHNIYAVAAHLTPYIFINKDKDLKFAFNYSLPSRNSLENFKSSTIRSIEKGQDFWINENTHNLAYYTDVEISEYPIYFPFADVVISTINQQPLIVDLAMSHNLKTFLPTRDESGKFIQVFSDNEDVSYRIRCYYDLYEIEGIPQDPLAFYLYNEKEDSWKELETLSSDSLFRYLEVELKGKSNLIRFGEPVIEITFKYVPYFVIIILGIICSAIFTVFYNFMNTKNIKERMGH